MTEKTKSQIDADRINDLAKSFFAVVIVTAAQSEIVRPDMFELELCDGENQYRQGAIIRLKKSNLPRLIIENDIVNVSEWRSRDTGNLRIRIEDYSERTKTVRPKTWKPDRIGKYAGTFVELAELQVVRYQRERDKQARLNQAREVAKNAVETDFVYQYFGTDEDGNKYEVSPTEYGIKVSRTYKFDPFDPEDVKRFENLMKTIRGEA